MLLQQVSGDIHSSVNNFTCTISFQDIHDIGPFVYDLYIINTSVGLHSTAQYSSIYPTHGQSAVMPHGILPWKQTSWISHLESFHIWHLGSLPGCSKAAQKHKVQEFQIKNFTCMSIIPTSK